jgi:hypothetical protein
MEFYVLEWQAAGTTSGYGYASGSTPNNDPALKLKNIRIYWNINKLLRAVYCSGGDGERGSGNTAGAEHGRRGVGGHGNSNNLSNGDGEDGDPGGHNGGSGGAGGMGFNFSYLINNNISNSNIQNIINETSGNLGSSYGTRLNNPRLNNENAEELYTEWAPIAVNAMVDTNKSGYLIIQRIA